MILKSEYGNDIIQPTDNDITNVLNELEAGIHSFIILENDYNNFIQTSGDNKQGYFIEYQENGIHTQRKSGRTFRIDQVNNIFKLFLKGDRDWITEAGLGGKNLMAVFGFTAEELQLNKQNKLSDNQKKKLNKYYKGRNLGMIIANIFLIGSLVLIQVMNQMSFDINSSEFEDSKLSLLIISVIILLLIIIMNILYFIKSRKLKKGIISYTEGIIDRTVNIPKRYQLTEFVIKIGKEYFLFQDPLENYAFESRKSYGIYYVKNTKFNIILSVEEL